MSTTFYVYEMWNPATNKPFYVGKSTYSRKGSRKSDHLYEARRVLNKKRKTNHKINTILKILKEGYNIDFRIVFETDSENTARDKEVELIFKYGRRDNGTGILTNMTDGGEGTVGYVFPQWLRELRKKLSHGKNNGMFGKNHSTETRQRISKYLKEGYSNGSISPTVHTEKHKQKLREDNKGGQATSKAIYQICTETGSIMNTFSSARQAAIILNIINPTKAYRNICSVAKIAKNRIAYGFYWRLVGDVSETYPLNVSKLNKNRGREMHSSKKVVQLDKNRQFIKEWESASEACRYLNKHVGNLNWYITRKKIYCGYYWMFTKDYNK